MSDFLNFIVSFFKYLWDAIKNTTVDLYQVLKNLDDFLFKYSSKSIPLIFTFVLARHFYKVVGGITTGVQQMRARTAPVPMGVPVQAGGAATDFAEVAKLVAANPELAKQAMGVAQQAVSNPALMQAATNLAQNQQQMIPPQIPQVQPQPVIIQQPVPQVQPQPVFIQQPGAPKVTMQQRFVQVRQGMKTDDRSKFVIFLMLFVIFAVEHYGDCSNQSGGSLDIKSFFRNGAWTIGFSYFLTMILTNIGPYGMIKSSAGPGVITDIMDGVVLYFVYNLVKNWRNITGKNTCEGADKKEGFDDTFEEEKELRFKYEPSLEEAVKELEKQKQEYSEYKKSNKMPTIDEQIPKAQRLLKNANIFIGRTDVYQAIDKLQQSGREITLDNLKSILDVDSPKPIETLKQQELATLPADRRQLKIPEMDVSEAGLPPILKSKKQLTSIDDTVIRSDKGRIIGVNLEKLQEKRIQKLQK